MSRFTIGILGGMGPRATVYFEQKLLDKLVGPDQSLPRIVVVNDGGIPDRTAYLCRDGEDPIPCLMDNAEALLRLDPDVICVPCNTAHADRVLGRLQSQLDLPLLDMPLAALEEAERVSCHAVLILGTMGTKLSRVYEKRASGTTIAFPSTAVQTEVNRLIADTKSFGFLESNRRILEQITHAASQSAVILACTELSMLNKDLDTQNVVIDALEALVDECVARIPEEHTINNR
jgi:aspartate racemase